MTFVSVYQQDSMLIKSLELKLAIYKLTLDDFAKEQSEDIIKVRELSCLITLYVCLGLKCQVTEDFICYLHDTALCCIDLEKQILVCGNLGILNEEGVQSLLAIKNNISDFIEAQIDQNRSCIYCGMHS